MNRMCLQKTWLLVVATIAIGCRPQAPTALPSNESSIAAEPPAPKLQSFELLTSAGELIRSEDLKGQVWVASYFFTQCGANCRMLNMEVSKLSKRYGPQGVRFVSLTCDPTNDTPEALADYAKLFNADDEVWTFTTGELQYLQKIGSDVFELSISERAHHARITVMDRNSAPRGTFDILEKNELRRATDLIDSLLAGRASADGDALSVDATSISE